VKTNKPLIAAIDAGTTGVRCCIFDFQGNEISNGYYKVPTIYPKPGWVEQDADAIIELAYKAVATALTGKSAEAAEIIGLCITSQRNSFVPIDKDGRFLTNMFIWQDQRGSEIHGWMKDCLREHNISLEEFYKRNGQPFGTFQAGNKAIWLRKNNKEIYDKTYKFVTPNAFLTKAFGAQRYFEENNDAGCWLMADADSQTIDERLCAVFDVDIVKFTESVRPGTKIGSVSAYAAKRTGLKQGIPIYMGSGDQQCGTLGAGNYGTTDIISVCMGTAGLCIAYSAKPVRHPGCKCNVQGHPAGGYTLEGHSSSCMSSFRWARDTLLADVETQLLVDDAERSGLATELAKQASAGSGGIIFLPWLQGAECPHYDVSAKGAFIGMSLATKRSDMLRAVMEGICFENRMMLETLSESGITPAKTLRVIGGAANNPFWNQMQADIYGLPVETVTAKECTALGAAIIGAVAAGAYSSYEEAVNNMVHVKRRYLPDEINKKLYDKLYDVWDSCYNDLSGEAYKRIFAFQSGI
jgi:xylulokinase